MNRNLEALTALMIPEDAARKLPSGSAVLQQSFDSSSELFLTLETAADEVASQISNKSELSLENMSVKEFEDFVKAKRSSVESNLRIIGHELMKLYYTNPAVQEGIGASSRAPFPQGYVLPDNDFDLLEEVFNRGPIYREVLND